MKALLLIVAFGAAMLSRAQEPALTSNVYRWSEAAAGRTPAGAERLIVKGTTLDLASLEIKGVTLNPGQSASRRPSGAETMEELIIVKSGRLTVTMAGSPGQVLGSNSVVVVLPGSEARLENAGDLPATYYSFHYKARVAVDADRGKAAGGSFAVDWTSLPYQPSPIGGRKNNFDRATTMFRRFEMHTSTVNASLTNHAAHTHRAEEMVLVIRGEVEMLIGETQQKAVAGDLIFLASEIPHSLKNIGTEPTEYFAVQWQ